MESNTNGKERAKQIMHKLFNRREKRIFIAAIAALIITTLTYNLAFAKEETHNIYQVYHVYADEQYIGAVDDQQVVEKLIEQEQEAASIQYKELSVDVGSNIKLISELVYRQEINIEETIENLKKALVVEADAYQVFVNDETVAYLKDKQQFDDVINQLKLKYVSKKQLDEVNARQLSSQQLPPLTVNETRITDIFIDELIEGKEVKIDPTKVVTSKKFLNILTSSKEEQVTYKVKEGDVLGSIASEHDLTTKQLLALNPKIKEKTVLKIGQKLNVTAFKPLVTVNVVYESVKEEKIPFEKVTKEDKTILKGETKVVQKGKDGKKQVTYETTKVNGQVVKKKVTEELEVKAATDEVTHKGTKVIPSRGTGSFAWPTNGGYISSTMGSRWGSYHRGIDIARPSNYTIKAADNGKVVFAGWDGTYGRKVVIDHNNGYQTLYGHLSSINVSVGQVVQRGSSIGVMGSTGRSTGIHLHFEVFKNGSNVNPLSYISR